MGCGFCCDWVGNGLQSGPLGRSEGVEKPAGGWGELRVHEGIRPEPQTKSVEFLELWTELKNQQRHVSNLYWTKIRPKLK